MNKRQKMLAWWLNVPNAISLGRYLHTKNMKISECNAVKHLLSRLELRVCSVSKNF